MGLEHAAKKWNPVFRIKHATTKDSGPCSVSFKTKHGPANDEFDALRQSEQQKSPGNRGFSHLGFA